MLSKEFNVILTLLRGVNMPKYKIGDIVECKVSGIADYGFFVRVDSEYSGLCHISEMSNEFVKNVGDFVHIGEIIYCQILDIDVNTKQMKMSIKNIYYKTEDDGMHIVESRKGFLPLKNMLPIWIDEKMKEYEKQKK